MYTFIKQVLPFALCAVGPLSIFAMEEKEKEESSHGYYREKGAVFDEHQAELNNMLFTAVARRDVEEVRNALRQGAEIDAMDHNNTTPLIRAITAISPGIVARRELVEANTKVIAALLESGCDPKLAGGYKECPPIFYAVIHGRREIVTLLVKYGAGLNSYEGNDKLQPLHHAAAGGNFGMVKTLLTLGGDINCRDFHGRQPLHYALAGKVAALTEPRAPFSESARRLVTTLLLETDADIVINSDDPALASYAQRLDFFVEQHMPALTLIRLDSQEKILECLNKLLSANSEENVRTLIKVFLLAANHGKKDIMMHLVQRFEFLPETLKGAFMVASRHNHREVVEFLYNGMPTNRYTTIIHQALEIASSRGCNETLQFFLSRYKPSLKIAKICFLKALFANRLATAQIWLSTIQNIIEKFRQTPANERDELIKLELARNDQLDQAEMMKALESLLACTEQAKFTQLLLEGEGENVSYFGRAIANQLVFCATRGQEAVVKFLLSSFEIPREFLKKALLRATTNKHPEIVLAITEHLGRTNELPHIVEILNEIFLRAANEGNTELVQYFLKLDHFFNQPPLITALKKVAECVKNQIQSSVDNPNGGGALESYRHILRLLANQAYRRYITPTILSAQAQGNQLSDAASPRPPTARTWGSLPLEIIEYILQLDDQFYQRPLPGTFE